MRRILTSTVTIASLVVVLAGCRTFSPASTAEVQTAPSAAGVCVVPYVLMKQLVDGIARLSAGGKLTPVQRQAIERAFLTGYQAGLVNGQMVCPGPVTPEVAKSQVEILRKAGFAPAQAQKILSERPSGTVNQGQVPPARIGAFEETICEGQPGHTVEGDACPRVTAVEIGGGSEFPTRVVTSNGVYECSTGGNDCTAF
jgi:hypothetical protein